VEGSIIATGSDVQQQDCIHFVRESGLAIQHWIVSEIADVSVLHLSRLASDVQRDEVDTSRRESIDETDVKIVHDTLNSGEEFD
jgi:hypothetical protein